MNMLRYFFAVTLITFSSLGVAADGHRTAPWRPQRPVVEKMSKLLTDIAKSSVAQ